MRSARTQPCLPFWSVLCALTAAGFWPADLGADEKPVRVLIQTGQNNHDWAATTREVQAILLLDGRFEVEVMNHPEAFDRNAGARYDVLLSNWNSWGDAGVREWPAQTREAFLEFIRQGHGLVVVHAGGSSFPDWNDYQNLIGGTWGKETGHGPVHTFLVRVSKVDHPITRGLQAFATTDELWHRMALRSPEVLATAYSDTAKGGSGKDEPVAFTTRFGEGRCFNLVLGHDAGAMKKPGFQLLLRRGTEWAARGAVRIPPNPGQDQPLIRAALDAAQAYTFGSDRAALLRLEALVAVLAPQESLEMARHLGDRLSSRQVTPEAKRFFCGLLSLVGTGQQVAALAALLGSEDFFNDALLALQRIPGPEAEAALLEWLRRVPPQGRPSLLNALATRAETKSVPQIADLAKSGDPASRAAAYAALGRIGGEVALQVLSELEPTPDDPLRPEFRKAQLAAAQSLVMRGPRAEVRALLLRLMAGEEPVEVRAAALLLYAANPEIDAGIRLLEALQNSDQSMRNAALQGLKLKGNQAALMQALADIDKLPPGTQVALLAAVEDTQAGEALPQVLALVRSSTGELRRMAIRTASALGDGSSVIPLVQLLENAPPEDRNALIAALSRLPGEGVDSALVQQCERGTPLIQAALLEALVPRNPPGLPGILVTSLKSDASSVRMAATKGLSKVGTSSELPALLEQLRSASEIETPAVESALAEMYRRGAEMTSLEAELRKAEALLKPRLLSVAAAVGGPQGLSLVESETSSPDDEVALAAIRLLAEWPDAAAFKRLSVAASEARNSRSRILAIRGMARLAPQVKEDPGAAAGALAGLMPQASAEEKVSLLNALGEIPGGAGLPTLAEYLDTPETSGTAGSASLKALEKAGPAYQALGKAMLEKIKRANTDPAVAEKLALLAWKFSDLPNLSVGAIASSTTGLKKDGEAGPPSAAIDGDPATYWDEVDNQKLYVLQVQLPQSARVAFLRISGWRHQQYAPKDFEVLCDGRIAAQVESAHYSENWLTVGLSGTECRTLELRIYGYYGGSPAIRELEIRGEPFQSSTRQ